MFTEISTLILSLSRWSLQALANGVWQGVIVALLFVGIAKTFPRLRAQTRFSLWTLGLVAVLTLPMITGQRAALPFWNSAAQTVRNSVESLLEDSTVTPESQSTLSAQFAGEEIPAVGETSPVTQDRQEIVVRDVQTDTESANNVESGSNRDSESSQQSQMATQSTDVTSTNQKSQSAEATTFLGASKTLDPTFTVTTPDWVAIALFTIWALIASLLLCRLLISFRFIRRLRRDAIAPDFSLEQKFYAMVDRLEIRRRATLLLSVDVRMPLAIGWSSPSVVLPVQLIGELSEDEIDQILIHELAHIKRYDDWTALFQRIAQALFFFNPVVYWLGRKMETDREMACDELVVERVNVARSYAACLTHLAELSQRPSNVSLAAGAMLTRNSLTRRVEKLLSEKLSLSKRASGLIVAASVIATVALVSHFALTPHVVAFEEPKQSASVSVSVPPISYEVFYPRSQSFTSSYSYSLSSGATVAMPSVGYTVSTDLHPVAVVTEENEPPRAYRIDADYLRELQEQIQERLREAQELQREYLQNKDNVDLTALRARIRELTESANDLRRKAESIPSERINLEPLEMINVSPGVSYTPEGSVAAIATEPYRAYSLGGNGDIVYAPQADGRPGYSVGRPGAIVVTPGVPSAPSVPSVPMAPIAGVGSFNSIFTDDGESTFTWSDGNRRIQVRAAGDIIFNDAGTDIESISDDGYIQIRERRGSTEREYEVSAYEDGKLERTYYENGRREEIDEDARLWISETILRVIRNTGFGAENRVNQLLKNSDYRAVLSEIEEITSSHAKRAYYQALFDSHKLNINDVPAVIRHFDREVDSDFERAEFLSGMDEDLLENDAVLTAYVESIGSMDSDFEKRRALSNVFTRENLPQKVLLGILDAAMSFDSDFERAELLGSIAAHGFNDPVVVDAYVRAVADIDSDFEKRRALEHALDDRELTIEATRAALLIAKTIDSDFERAQLLIDLYPHSQTDEGLLKAYVDAVVDIDSDFETRRVLQTLTDRRDLSPEVTLTALQIASTMDSDFERAELLIDLSEYCEGNDQLWEAYVTAVTDINSDFERSRVLQRVAFDERTSEKVLLSTLQIAENMSSDFEKAKILRDLADVCLDNENLREPFMDAVDSINSDYERDGLLRIIYRHDRRNSRER